MVRSLLMLAVVFTLTGCTSLKTRGKEQSTLPGMEVSTESASGDMLQNVRLAQAQLISESGEMIKGTLNFEQMPNSVIVTYRLEGLTPKGEYQIFVKEQLDCSSANQGSAVGLKELRANKQGVSENTFKIENFSVSGKQALLGRSVVIASRPSPSDRTRPTIACGQVLPLVPTPQIVQ